MNVNVFIVQVVPQLSPTPHRPAVHSLTCAQDIRFKKKYLEQLIIKIINQ